MKITCQSCQAKYTIADEKVAGKTVKIKCKKCGATIVVSGTDSAIMAAPAPAMASGAPPQVMGAAPPGDDDEGEGATRVFSEGGGGQPGGGEEWTVNVTDEDQRTLTAGQIVVEFQRGVVNTDTYVWKDGMGDWLPLGEVPELMRMLSAVRPAAGAPAPVAMPSPMSPMAAVPSPMAAAPMAAAPMAMDADPGAALGGTMIMTEQPMSPMAGGGISPAISPAAAAASGPVAAKRAAKSPAIDLFASGQHERSPAASAVTTSADRLVGERNENSVLFSISALTASAGAAKKNDDPFDLGAPPPRNGRGNVDDIMNLGGGMGGMGAPMLAPPPLLAPVVEAPPPPPAPMPVAASPAMGSPAMGGARFAAAPMMVPEYTPPKSKAPLIVGIVGALAILGGVGVFFAMRGGGSPTAGTESTATHTPTTEAAPTMAAAPPTPAPSATPDTPKPADTTPAGASAASTTPAATTAPAANPGKTPAGPGPGPKPNDKLASALAAEKEKPEAKPDPKPDPKPEPEAKKPDKPADTGGNGRDFDRAAASSALSAASGAARGCKKDDGPTGTARVSITFAPSGSVTSSSVDGSFAGTSVGGCIAAAFRGVHVPAFDGSPVTVHKSVTIN